MKDREAPATPGPLSFTCTTGATADLAYATARFSVAPGGDIACTFTNTQQLAAIKIGKTGKDKSQGSGDQALDAALAITDPNSYSNSVSTSSDVTDCVANLPFRTYSVQETAVPRGYRMDDTTARNVTVNTNSTCVRGTATRRPPRGQTHR